MTTPILVTYLESLEKRFNEAELLLINSTSAEERSNASKTTLDLRHLVQTYKEYKTKYAEKEELKELITGEDKEMVVLAKQELADIEDAMKELEIEVLENLVPYERSDNNDVVLEVTAGVGGQEAMLFTDQIFSMYTHYAAYKGWRFDITQYDPNEIGGIRYGSAIVRGEGVYQALKFEGGVHRVQRVPKTEKSGRIHTSTMAVSIMPRPTEIDIVINKSDIKTDVFRASGAGGQHVNKTESAVRLTHLPTGVVAECQVSRSQITNKDLALEILRTKLYNQKFEEQQSKYNSQRKIQIGTASRSEKIRTYNFKEDRISDHRLGQNLFDLEEFLSGGEALDDLHESLLKASQAEQLLEMLEEFQQFENK